MVVNIFTVYSNRDSEWPIYTIPHPHHDYTLIMKGRVVAPGDGSLTDRLVNFDETGELQSFVSVNGCYMTYYCQKSNLTNTIRVSSVFNIYDEIDLGWFMQFDYIRRIPDQFDIHKYSIVNYDDEIDELDTSATGLPRRGDDFGALYEIEEGKYLFIGSRIVLIETQYKINTLLFSDPKLVPGTNYYETTQFYYITIPNQAYELDQPKNKNYINVENEYIKITKLYQNNMY